ncbi:cytochrome P450, partial [Kalaharituber pfeilii]
GPIIRVAPNELSFSSAAAWKDIHGHRPRGPPFVKSDFYFTGDTYNRVNIITEKDIVRHAEVRRLLAHAFSAKALQEQEELIHKHIDLFVQRLGKRYADKEKGPDGEHCNLVHWYNFTTFDVIGDLAFGDTAAFGCLENEKPHPFVTMILSSPYVLSLANIFRRYPFMLKLGYFFTPKNFSMVGFKIFSIVKHLSKGIRMSMDTNRKDFMAYILDKKDSFPHIDIPSNAELLVIAGSETTATLLSGLTYYLFKMPEAYQRLTEEIRTSFQNYSDIDSISTQHLPYLNAVIEEGLRIYPPVPVGLPRISPGAMVAGHFIPPGTEVSVHAYSASHNPDNFAEPDRFLPERWLQEGKFNDRKEASQPFLLGTRGCLGRNLAYMELRLILAKMLYCYDLEWVNTDLDWEEKSRVWILWMKPDLKVHIKSREGMRWDELGLPDDAA